MRKAPKKADKLEKSAIKYFCKLGVQADSTEEAVFWLIFFLSEVVFPGKIVKLNEGQYRRPSAAKLARVLSARAAVFRTLFKLDLSESNWSIALPEPEIRFGELSIDIWRGNLRLNVEIPRNAETLAPILRSFPQDLSCRLNRGVFINPGSVVNIRLSADECLKVIV